jgi:hypothetical protein
MVGASANIYYVPAGGASAGHGFFPAGAAGGVGPGSSPPLRTMLVKQIEYYFRLVEEFAFLVLFRLLSPLSCITCLELNLSV